MGQQLISNRDKIPKEKRVNKNSFEFDTVIGKGGFGKVWKVIEKKTHKIYALKEMSKACIIDKKSEKSVRFERELLAHIRHPFIVNLIYSFQDCDNLYLVIDYLNGGDLRFHLCQRRTFSEEQTRFFIGCLILGLEYIHNHNVIHRDIKPENLILESGGYLRITDFGIAKFYQKQNYQDTSGTPGYMSPEVIKGQNHTRVVDYYAIGIIGYELMLGRRPYKGKNRKEIKEQMLSYQARIKEEDLPEGWGKNSCKFINGLLIRKPEKRLGYKSIEELKRHPWFNNLNWNYLLKKTIESPFIPSNVDNYDKKYCNSIDEEGLQTRERYEEIMRSKLYEDMFINFTYYPLADLDKKKTYIPHHKRFISNEINRDNYDIKTNSTGNNLINYIQPHPIKGIRKKMSQNKNKNNIFEYSLVKTFKHNLNSMNNRHKKLYKDTDLFMELLSSRTNNNESSCYNNNNTNSTTKNKLSTENNLNNISNFNQRIIIRNNNNNNLIQNLNTNTNNNRNYKKSKISKNLFDIIMDSNKKHSIDQKNYKKSKILNKTRFNSFNSTNNYGVGSDYIINLNTNSNLNSNKKNNYFNKNYNNDNNITNNNLNLNNLTNTSNITATNNLKSINNTKTISNRKNQAKTKKINNSIYTLKSPPTLMENQIKKNLINPQISHHHHCSLNQNLSPLDKLTTLKIPSLSPRNKNIYKNILLNTFQFKTEHFNNSNSNDNKKNNYNNKNLICHNRLSSKTNNEFNIDIFNSNNTYAYATTCPNNNNNQSTSGGGGQMPTNCKEIFKIPTSANNYKNKITKVNNINNKDSKRNSGQNTNSNNISKYQKKNIINSSNKDRLLVNKRIKSSNSNQKENNFNNKIIKDNIINNNNVNYINLLNSNNLTFSPNQSQNGNISNINKNNCYIIENGEDNNNIKKKNNINKRNKNLSDYHNTDNKAIKNSCEIKNNGNSGGNIFLFNNSINNNNNLASTNDNINNNKNNNSNFINNKINSNSNNIEQMKNKIKHNIHHIKDNKTITNANTETHSTLYNNYFENNKNENVDNKTTETINNKKENALSKCISGSSIYEKKEDEKKNDKKIEGEEEKINKGNININININQVNNNFTVNNESKNKFKSHVHKIISKLKCKNKTEQKYIIIKNMNDSKEK